MINITNTKVTILDDGGKRLGKFDTEHLCKMIASQKNLNYLRLIKVNTTINAPIQWWIEYKDYHKNKKYKDDDILFNYDKYWELFPEPFRYDMFDGHYRRCVGMDQYIQFLNNIRADAILNDNIEIYRQLVGLLPLNYRIELDVELNYENIYRIYKHYKNTGDINWINFINWVNDLPYNYIFTEKGE